MKKAFVRHIHEQEFFFFFSEMRIEEVKRENKSLRRDELC